MKLIFVKSALGSPWGRLGVALGFWQGVGRNSHFSNSFFD
jgi:hypothetical protein